MNPVQAASIPPVQAALSSVGSTNSATGGGDFGSLITGFLNSLGQTEKSTDQLIASAATGGNVDVHDVMLATQAESLAFQVGVQVRNKLVEAYQDIYRMQM